MFTPTKYENLQNSTIVLGADIIKTLKKDNYNIEELFQELKENSLKKENSHKDISLNQYYNTLIFLWLTDIILIDDFLITLNK